MKNIKELIFKCVDMAREKTTELLPEQLGKVHMAEKHTKEEIIQALLPDMPDMPEEKPEGGEE